MIYSREALDLARYQIAVADNPRLPGEGAMTYCARIAELVAAQKLPEPAKDMPEIRMPYRESE